MDKEREPHLGYRVCWDELDSTAAGLCMQPAIGKKLWDAA
ncbi:hypothetical protein Tco_0701709, partial [Tanacetum coccineum]